MMPVSLIQISVIFSTRVIITLLEIRTGKMMINQMNKIKTNEVIDLDKIIVALKNGMILK